MYSTEWRVDRYRVIYMWKIIQGRVPNCGLTWGPSGRRGLQVQIPPLSGSRAAIKKLREKSFKLETPHLFNALPSTIWEMTGSVAAFKAALDGLLSLVPDTPLSDTRVSFATDMEGKQH